jgi:uncharacterized membrane protein YkoI
MKKIVIALSIAVVVAVGGLIALTVYVISQNSREPPQEPIAQYDERAYAELAAEIAELQAMLDSLLAGQNEGTTNSAGLISVYDAIDIAEEYVGHGELADIFLFNDEGVLTFEVDIRRGVARYMVYVNAISGEVISMSRFIDNEEFE